MINNKEHSKTTVKTREEPRFNLLTNKEQEMQMDESELLGEPPERE
jgi:hypothetical protein